MHTKLLMMASAIFMGAIGISLTFIPHEIGSYLGMGTENISPLSLQLAGALYLAFAMLNWMAKANLMGGIYSRPVSVGNFAHFFIGGMALLKTAFGLKTHFEIFLALTIGYSIFAIAFGYVFTNNPKEVANKN